MLILSPIFRLFDLILGESSRFQLCMGAVLGMCLGLTPIFSLQWVMLWLMFFFVRFNLLSGLISFFIFSALHTTFYPVFNVIGNYLLSETKFLDQFWEFVLNMPIFPYTNFNNSTSLGSFICCMLLAYPLYWSMDRSIVFFNLRLSYRIHGSRLMRSWRASRLNRLYEQSKQTAR